MFIRTMAQVALLGLSMLAGFEQAWGQEPNASPEKAAANASYEAKDWQKAEQLYGKITAADPTKWAGMV